MSVSARYHITMRCTPRADMLFHVSRILFEERTLAFSRIGFFGRCFPTRNHVLLSPLLCVFLPIHITAANIVSWTLLNTGFTMLTVYRLPAAATSLAHTRFVEFLSVKSAVTFARLYHRITESTRDVSSGESMSR